MIVTHDVLVQHIRFRPGDAPGSACVGAGDLCDALQVIDLGDEKDVYNVVIDHCSLSWSMDEIWSTWYSGVHDVTIMNSIMSEALHESSHGKGAHGYGPLVGNHASNVAMIGNLMAHAYQRNPLLGIGAKAVVANNVIYNYGEIATHARGEDYTYLSAVGNVYIKGPNSSSIKPIYIYGVQPGSLIYVSDNEYDGTVPDDPWSVVYINDPSAGAETTDPPIWVSPFSVKPSSQVKDWVLVNAGARPADRDSVDTRIVNDVRNGTGQIINCVEDDGSAQCQKNAGGWPELAQNIRPITLPNNPDGDDDGDGYTNLEEWLHESAAQVEGSATNSLPAPPTGLRIN